MRAVVTGANRGIGLAITTLLLERGDEVVVGVRKTDAESLKKLKEEHGDRLNILHLDLSDPDSIEDFSNSVEGVVDVLFNNAGVLFRDSLKSFDYEKFLYTLKVNTLGPFALSSGLLKNLRLSKRPRILNTSSIMGSITTFSGTHSVSYSVSKAALNMVTRAMAAELRSEGIVVVSVHPGWVRTDMGGSAAPVLPKESARGIVKLADGLTMEDSGKFFDYTLKEIPW